MLCTASPWECSCRDNAGLYIVSFWQLCFGSKHTHTTVHGWAFIVKGASPCCTGLKQQPVVHVASVVKVFWAALIRLVITGQGSHSKFFVPPTVSLSVAMRLGFGVTGADIMSSILWANKVTSLIEITANSTACLPWIYAGVTRMRFTKADSWYTYAGLCAHLPVRMKVDCTIHICPLRWPIRVSKELRAC